MDLPLELAGLTLSRTADNSRTELRVDVRHVDGLAWLPVRDAQDLAGALLQWLDDCGHAMPAVPANWLLQQVPLEDDEEWEPVPDPTFHSLSRPPRQTGALVVRRDGERLTIGQADEWVTATTELLDQLRAAPSPFATMDGLTLTLTDSDGRRAVYVARPDLDAPAGAVVLAADQLAPAAGWRCAAGAPALMATRGGVVVRGTSNGNQRGSAAQRRARRAWLVAQHGWPALGIVLCYLCSVPLLQDEDPEAPGESVTVDRIVPGCRGGTYSQANIRPACGPCNSETGGRTRRG